MKTGRRRNSAVCRGSRCCNQAHFPEQNHVFLGRLFAAPRSFIHARAIGRLIIEQRNREHETRFRFCEVLPVRLLCVSRIRPCLLESKVSIKNWFTLGADLRFGTRPTVHLKRGLADIRHPQIGISQGYGDSSILWHPVPPVLVPFLAVRSIHSKFLRSYRLFARAAEILSGISSLITESGMAIHGKMGQPNVQTLLRPYPGRNSRRGTGFCNKRAFPLCWRSSCFRSLLRMGCLIYSVCAVTANRFFLKAQPGP